MRHVPVGGTAGLLAVLAVAVVLRAPLLAGGQIDYDEGVYWQSLRALAAGKALFTSVYSSQPPAFLDGVLATFDATVLLKPSMGHGLPDTLRRLELEM